MVWPSLSLSLSLSIGLMLSAWLQPSWHVSAETCDPAVLKAIEKQFKKINRMRGCGHFSEHMAYVKSTVANESVLIASEVGVRESDAIWALLDAARERLQTGAPPLTIHLYDITTRTGLMHILSLMSRCPAIKIIYTECNDLIGEIKPTDVMLLDTWNSYMQLSAELMRLPPIVRDVLMIHNTWGRFGERDNVGNSHRVSTRLPQSGHASKAVNAHHFKNVSGIELHTHRQKGGKQKKSLSTEKHGLRAAIDEFLHGTSEWELYRTSTKCDGLTTVVRIDPETAHIEPIPLLNGSSCRRPGQRKPPPPLSQPGDPGGGPAGGDFPVLANCGRGNCGAGRRKEVTEGADRI